MPTTFNVDELSLTITSDPLTLDGIQAAALDGYVADFDADLETFKNMFQYYTDGSGNNLGEVRFRILGVEGGEDFGMLIDASANSAYKVSVIDDDVAGGVIFENKCIGLDYLRRQALHYFNTVQGVILFSNEATILTKLQTDFSADIKSTISSLAEYRQELGVVSSGTSVSKKIFDHMVYTDPTRLENIEPATTYNGFAPVDSNGKTWYKFEFVADDVIAFNLTIASNGQQTNITNASETATPLANQKYLIKIHLKAQQA